MAPCGKPTIIIGNKYIMMMEKYTYNSWIHTKIVTWFEVSEGVIIEGWYSNYASKV